MTDTAPKGLKAAEMRALLSSLFGSKYVIPAAAALGVQEARIRFWTDDKQDGSRYASSPKIKAELEAIFAARVNKSDRIEDRVHDMAEAVSYLDDLIDRFADE